MVASTWDNDLAGWAVITLNFGLVDILLTVISGYSELLRSTLATSTMSTPCS